MSSYEGKTELRGKDLENLSQQWGYGTPSRSRRKDSRETDSQFGPRFLAAMNSLICALMTFAGAATTVALAAWLCSYFPAWGLSFCSL